MTYKIKYLTGDKMRILVVRSNSLQLAYIKACKKLEKTEIYYKIESVEMVK